MAIGRQQRSYSGSPRRRAISRIRSANRLKAAVYVLRSYADGLTVADDGDYCTYGDYICGNPRRSKKMAGPDSGPAESNAAKDTLHPMEANSRAISFGMKWNETAFWRACKLLKMWWPGTELNRRRQPFQGWYLQLLPRRRCQLAV